jgi:hypothetical protein
VQHPSNDAGWSRRDLLIRGGVLVSLSAFLAGCQSGSSGRAAAMPDVNWPDEELNRKLRIKPRPVAVQKPRPMPAPDVPGGVIPRSEWARGEPVAPRMTVADRPFTRITIHHDGMDTFTTTDRGSAAARLEQIRNAHLNRPGEPFGDIGYHYLIDPAGRVWAGRPLKWQGAHVAKKNAGNLGICCLGNFQQQRPSEAQVAALDRFVVSQMQRYSVPTSQVFTHRELGSTVCPGNNMQGFIDMSRTSGAMARG